MSHKETLLEAIVQFRNECIDLADRIRDGEVPRKELIARLEEGAIAAYELRKAVLLMNEPEAPETLQAS